jgi:hypothetical protein
MNTSPIHHLLLYLAIYRNVFIHIEQTSHMLQGILLDKHFLAAKVRKFLIIRSITLRKLEGIYLKRQTALYLVSTLFFY